MSDQLRARRMFGTMRECVETSLAGIASLLLSMSATATPITIDAADFPDAASFNSNITVGGLRFSPDCHFHASASGGAPSPIIAIDSSGCGSGLSNPDYLGPASVGEKSRLYIDAGGEQFTLLSLTWHVMIPVFVSSNGGSFRGPGTTYGEFVTTNFSGPEWTNIDWLVWSFPHDPGAPCCGIKSLTVEISHAVPEPASLALLCVGFGVFALSRRRGEALGAGWSSQLFMDTFSRLES